MAGKRIITIFGSTGNQGGSVVKTFLSDSKLKNDWAVRGVTRNVDSESAKKLSSQGVEMVAVSQLSTVNTSEARTLTSTCRPI